MILPISVVIPTMNRPESLYKTLDWLLKVKYNPDQIIVVDQSSNNENTKHIIEILNLKYNTDINYQYLAEPSLTKARNIGAKFVKNDVMICMDDDVEIRQDTLFQIWNLMDPSIPNNKIAMIGAIDELNGKGNSKLGYFFGYKSYRNKDIGFVTKAMFGKYPNKITGSVKTQWTMGYFFCIRKSLLDKWDLQWDEYLISYGYPEDLDFSYSYYKNAESEQLECILNENVTVKHLGSQEWRIPTYKNTLMFVINREYLSYKHFPNILSRFFTRWANIGTFMLRLITKKNPFDLIKAQYYCDKHRRDIKNGDLPYELFS